MMWGALFAISVAMSAIFALLAVRMAPAEAKIQTHKEIGDISHNSRDQVSAASAFRAA
jgi:hypothetical protein